MTLTLRITDITEVAPGIRSLTLTAADGGELPAFVPGSHLVLDLGERSNAYSLTGDGTAPTSYGVSVLHVAEGGGGSAYVHDRLAVDDIVTALPPRSAFAPVARAQRHLLVAGGIGITPIVSHLRAARTWGRDVQVLYAFREGHAAHVEDVLDLADGSAELLTGGREAFCARLEQVLAEQPIGTHLYVCGPGALIDATLDLARAAGWPPSRLHAERFGVDTLDPGDPFSVDLTESGTRLEVPGGTSLLEALEAAGMRVPNMCRQGVCGECRIPVVSGAPLHRDLYLSDEEKAAGDALMACVSRADGTHLEVPL